MPPVPSVATNLAVLGLFKYAGLIVGSLDGALGLRVPAPRLALPLGVSFFTFHALSYLIDVSRRLGAGCR